MSRNCDEIYCGRDGGRDARGRGGALKKEKRRRGLFLERLWRVGELNTADTCQGFWGCNRGTFRKKGCLANEHRRIRMAGRERMHTKRFSAKLAQPAERHISMFSPFHPRASERVSECLQRCGESWERCPAPYTPLRPGEFSTSEQAPSREVAPVGRRRDLYQGRLPSIYNSLGRHLGPRANRCDRLRFPAHLHWSSGHALATFCQWCFLPHDSSDLKI